MYSLLQILINWELNCFVQLLLKVLYKRFILKHFTIKEIFLFMQFIKTVNESFVLGNKLYRYN